MNETKQQKNREKQKNRLGKGWTGEQISDGEADGRRAEKNGGPAGNARPGKYCGP
jgi:hypothetical protein